MQSHPRSIDPAQLEAQLGDITEERPHHGQVNDEEPLPSDALAASDKGDTSTGNMNLPTYVPPSTHTPPSESRRTPTLKSRKASPFRFLPQRLLPPWRQRKTRRRSEDLTVGTELQQDSVPEKSQDGFYQGHDTHSVESIPPAYTEEARNLVRSFTSANLVNENPVPRPRSVILKLSHG